MKVSKLLLSAMAVAGLAASASAQTYVHIVGSTAFRPGVQQAIVDSMGGYSNCSGVYWGNSTYKKCSGAAISGTINGNWTIIETYWTGSLAGVVDISAQTQDTKFISWANNGGASVTSGSLTYISTTPTFESAVVPDAAMSDSYYQSIASELADSKYVISGSSQAPGTLTTLVDNAGLTDAGTTTTGSAGAVHTVGVVPFRWVLGVTGSYGETVTNGNITQEVARSLATSGYVQMSQITGSTADLNNFAVLIGRNEDSGTRIDSLSETQAENANGVNYDFPPIQVVAGFGGTVATESGVATGTAGYYVGGTNAQLTSISLWPKNYALNTEPNITWTSYGHSGYYTGGDVANVLSAANDLITSGTNVGSGQTTVLINSKENEFTAGTSTVSLIGYLGISDAATAIGNGAQPLSYNGVTYSDAAVENGQYTIWGYEHMYYTTGLTASPSGTVLSVINNIADILFATDADIDATDALHDNPVKGQAGILYGNMKVVRSAQEGGIITNQ